MEQQVTHVMVVSDSPGVEHEIDQRLEARMRALDIDHALTVPLAVREKDGPFPL